LSLPLPYASQHYVALNAPPTSRAAFSFQEPHVRRLPARVPQTHWCQRRGNDLGWLICWLSWKPGASRLCICGSVLCFQCRNLYVPLFFFRILVEYFSSSRSHFELPSHSVSLGEQERRQRSLQSGRPPALSLFLRNLTAEFGENSSDCGPEMFEPDAPFVVQLCMRYKMRRFNGARSRRR